MSEAKWKKKAMTYGQKIKEMIESFNAEREANGRLFAELQQECDVLRERTSDKHLIHLQRRAQRTEKAEKKMKEYKTRARDLETQLKSQKKKLKSVQHELSGVKDQLELLKKQKAQQSAAGLATQGRNQTQEQMRALLGELTDEIEEMRIQIDGQERSKKDLERQLDESEHRNQELERRLADLEETQKDAADDNRGLTASSSSTAQYGVPPPVRRAAPVDDDRMESLTGPNSGGYRTMKNLNVLMKELAGEVGAKTTPAKVEQVTVVHAKTLTPSKFESATVSPVKDEQFQMFADDDDDDDDENDPSYLRSSSRSSSSSGSSSSGSLVAVQAAVVVVDKPVSSSSSTSKKEKKRSTTSSSPSSKPSEKKKPPKIKAQTTVEDFLGGRANDTSDASASSSQLTSPFCNKCNLVLTDNYFKLNGELYHPACVVCDFCDECVVQNNKLVAKQTPDGRHACLACVKKMGAKRK